MNSFPSKNSNGIWVGIDFGTSNSCAAVWDSSRGSSKWIRLPMISKQEISGKHGRMVPSVVRIHGDDHFSVGAQAIHQQQADDDSKTTSYSSDGTLVSSIKRLFGRRYQDLDSHLLESLPFHVEEDENEKGAMQLVVPGRLLQICYVYWNLMTRSKKCLRKAIWRWGMPGRY